MKQMGDPRAHFWRTLKMAKATGVPLATALKEGKISKADYARIIETCRRCPHPGQCNDVLSASIPMADPPHFCTNRAELMALKQAAD